MLWHTLAWSVSSHKGVNPWNPFRKTARKTPSNRKGTTQVSSHQPPQCSSCATNQPTNHLHLHHWFPGFQPSFRPVPALPSPWKAASHQALDVQPPTRWMDFWKLVETFWRKQIVLKKVMMLWLYQILFREKLSWQKPDFRSPEMAGVSVHVDFQSVTLLRPIIQGASGRVIY